MVIHGTDGFKLMSIEEHVFCFRISLSLTFLCVLILVCFRCLNSLFINLVDNGGQFMIIAILSIILLGIE